MATIKYDNATYRTHGDLPPIGSRAPDVSLVNTKLQNATLANWLGIRKVMNIIVSVDTEVCAKSVIEFDRRAADLEDVVVLTVSYDLPFAYKRFLEKHELKNIIALSAIRHAGFGENYGVQIVDAPFAGGAEAVQVGPSAHRGGGAQCNGLEDVAAAADAAVTADLGAALHLLGDRRDERHGRKRRRGD